MKTFKRILLPVIAFACLAFQPLQAQIDVSINPVGLLFGDFNVGADFALSDKFSVEGTVGFGVGDRGIGNNDSDFSYFGLPVTVFGKYYFNPRNGADKFYADAWLRFVTRGFTASDNSGFADYNQTRMGIGFGIGYKVVSDGGFVFDIGFGAGRAFVDNTSFSGGGSETAIDWPDIMFAGKLGIGYRFGTK